MPSGGNVGLDEVKRKCFFVFVVVPVALFFLGLVVMVHVVVFLV